MLVLLMLSFLGNTPVFAQCSPRAGECLAPPYAVPAEPVWGTLNAVPGGNYPGGSLAFDVFVIDTGYEAENATLFNETVTASALPAGLNTSTAKGLPLMLTPGQAITSTITMPIPSDFAQTNLSASLVVNVSYWNGTANIPVKLTGSAVVYILGGPLGGTQTTTSSTSQSTQTTTQGGTVSTTLFAAAVATPSIVVVLLLILLVRGRSRPK
jgi:hypothetical protein